MKNQNIEVIADEPSINISELRKTSFSGDVLRLTFGSVFVQVLAVLTAPFLTRLYSPEAFGIVALFASITGIIIVASCMRYELAIMLPKSDKEAANLLGVSLIFVILVSALTIPVVWYGRTALLRWLNAPHLAPYLWLIPPAVMIGGIFSALSYWSSRTKHFTWLSIARFTDSASTISTQISAGYAGYTTGGSLIGAGVVGQAVSTAVLGGRIWRDDRKVLLRFICFRDMIEGIKRHRKFPIYSTLSAVMNAISVQLPIFLLSAFFSPVVVGLYALGYRILSTPMAIMGQSVAQVFYQRASVAKSDGTLSEVVEKTFKQFVSLSAFPFLLITFVGADIFSAVFGQKWTEAGLYAQILAPWIFLTFLASPISTLCTVFERQDVGLFFNIVLIAVRVISLFIGGILGNIVLALVLFSVSSICSLIWLCMYLIHKTGLKVIHMVKIFTSQIFLSGLFVLPVIFVKYVLAEPSLAVLSVAGSVSLLYYVNYAVRDDTARVLIAKFLQQKRG